MPKFKQGSSRTMGRDSASSLSASQINTIVRRLGHVAHMAYQTMMSRLIDDEQARLAEALSDCLKPCVDYLIHFDLSEEMVETEVSDET